MTGIRDRIKELRRVPARDLRPHPDNWRLHPDGQRDALAAVLEEIGYADALLAYEEDGALVLFDGHLRKDISEDEEVPVLVTDLTPEEARTMLTVLDPLAAMAEADQAALDKLVADIETENEALQEMLDRLSAGELVFQAEEESGNGGAEDNTYTNKIVSPIYEPKGEKPSVAALCDREKTNQLLREIGEADLPEEVATFLRLAAERHTIFNFRQIAEFYCHTDTEVQSLMEKSGLVIIDFNKAIEYGFVQMTERLGTIADREEFHEG